MPCGVRRERPDQMTQKIVEQVAVLSSDKKCVFLDTRAPKKTARERHGERNIFSSVFGGRFGSPTTLVCHPRFHRPSDFVACCIESRGAEHDTDIFLTEIHMKIKPRCLLNDRRDCYER